MLMNLNFELVEVDADEEMLEEGEKGGMRFNDDIEI